MNVDEIIQKKQINNEVNQIIDVSVKVVIEVITLYIIISYPLFFFFFKALL
jgi:hypothetical protein